METEIQGKVAEIIKAKIEYRGQYTPTVGDGSTSNHMRIDAGGMISSDYDNDKKIGSVKDTIL